MPRLHPLIQHVSRVSHFKYELLVDYLAAVYIPSTMYTWTPMVSHSAPDFCAESPKPHINK